ncbi:hypothetical protein T12_8745 [Trichinella patagoniensis]|uniref:Uncharacterized protein n=2 Tax=Trichinella patagoniensis TaxID=990121 RepID=A0A0V0ZH05_9BILA|nr:hypothetical protein T12_8745 [Trichinella patagoniensis]
MLTDIPARFTAREQADQTPPCCSPFELTIQTPTLLEEDISTIDRSPKLHTTNHCHMSAHYHTLPLIARSKCVYYGSRVLRGRACRDCYHCVADADPANNSIPPENEAEERWRVVEEVFGITSSSFLAFGKRETERTGNPSVNTGPSPNSDERTNNTIEEANEPARGSGSL